ncbi:LacI family DNA-binding transcriptional regulator [Nakamurella endophytica]|uniref:LacI family transcriptional regulator n=1 Tax=Nakamurella endophytica TaxID=1748367 RepID=A0A917SYW7_9ACTN|nr:LacI family DNA-binding transcriptional regulator [Nakamurella endophytica]GGM02987.1 LacI family transcriptional regulator [Nakamurella endophytica]
MPGPVTLADVARAAGVSLATASRALNGAPGRRVGGELRSRVLLAAARLHYSPNANAQAMARGTSATVGLVVHDIADPFAASVASGVIEAAAERDLLVSVSATQWDPETEIRHVEALRRQRARAVILAGSRWADDEVEERLVAQLAGVVAAGGHVAVVGQRLASVNSLALGNAAGARRLARVLWTLGYRRFAVLSGSERQVTSEERLTGFRDGLADCGHRLPDENVIATQPTRDGGYVAMTELLDREIDVEAVFAISDVMAVGAMAALREQGYRVPQDMALAGFEDIPALRDLQPPLTSVRIRLDQLGRRALDLALGAPSTGAPAPTSSPPSAGSAADPVHLVVQGEVVVRASTPVRTVAGGAG